MPYEIEKDGDCYVVKNKDSGDVKGRHCGEENGESAKERAERQVRLLHGVEHGWEPDNG